MSKQVDSYFNKATQWRDEMLALRTIIKAVDLDESLNWGKPCYGGEGGNIVILQPFKDFLSLMFFQGKCLKDAKGVLVANGPNSQSAMRLEFRSVREVNKCAALIKRYLKEAIAIESSGQKVAPKSKPEAVPEELTQAFRKKPRLKKAFEALTPGRQRGYILHFCGAKQSATRHARIEKCTEKILAGKGLNDR